MRPSWRNAYFPPLRLKAIVAEKVARCGIKSGIDRNGVVAAVQPVRLFLLKYGGHSDVTGGQPMLQRNTAACTVIGAMVLAAIVSSAPAEAQDVRAEVDQAINAARRTNPGLTVRINPKTGLPASIRGLNPRNDPNVAPTARRSADSAPSAEDVRRAVEAYFATSDMRTAFPQRHAQARREPLGDPRPDPDLNGYSVQRVTQKVNGIAVFGSSATVVVDPRLAARSIAAGFSTVMIESTIPGITDAEAIGITRDHIRKQLSRRSRDSAGGLFAGIDAIQPTAELSVFDPALMGTPGLPRLTWLVSIETLRVFVDAQTRAVLFYYQDHPTLMMRRVYDLSSDYAFPGKKVLDEETSERLDPVTDDALRAFENTGVVRDFLDSVLGRNGIDGGKVPGFSIESYVRFGAEKNAWWCTNKFTRCPKTNIIVYGPGYAGALDVVAHEVTHGVIAHEAELVYSNEPGAVNEAMADIFGTLIEFHGKGGNGNWVIGETLPGYSEANPLRSMAAPHMGAPSGPSRFDKAKDFTPDNRGQPDHYSELVERSDPICDSTDDVWTGCVHFNSGVLNKFAYLVSEGGVHKGVEIKGLGRGKLARIAYRALTTKFTATSTLVQASDAFVAACEELSDANVASISAQDCAEVKKSQSAVGLATDS